MPEIKTRIQCPKCAHTFNAKTVVTPEMTVPLVAGKIKPSHQIMVYRITSNDINKYICDVVRSVVPDCKPVLYPRYTEKKRKKNNGPRNSYVYLLLAMNDKSMEQNRSGSGFYGSMGWKHSTRLKTRLWTEFVSRWLYNPEWVRKVLGSYNEMDDYEERLGLTEKALKDIRLYSKPQAIYPNGSKTPWVLTALDPYMVIQDMLCEAGTRKIPGEILITDINQVSENMIEWTVYVSPFKNEPDINPHVLQILRGEEKIKSPI